MAEYAPVRPLPAQVAVLVGGFFGAPLLGGSLAAVGAPDSWVASLVGGGGFLLAFPVAMMAWLGLGIVGFLLDWGRGRNPSAGETATQRLVPRGYGAFTVAYTAAGLCLGLVTGLFGPWRVAPALLVCAAAGWGWGRALAQAARAGYLPFPEAD